MTVSGGRLDARPDRGDALAMAGVLFLLLVSLWVFGELIPVADGFGFGDGRTYGRLAMGFPDFSYVDEYRMARVLPALAVNVAHRLVPGTATVATTVVLFRLMNVTLLMGAALLWYVIARRWSLSRAATWIGFAGLFLNFANLKLALYYPTLTDTAAFTFGVLLLYAFVIRNIFLTGVLAVAAAFVSPPLVVSALLLLIIPRIDTPLLANHRPALRRLSTAFAVVFGLGIGLWLWNVDGRFEGSIVASGEKVWRSTFWLSVGIAVIYVIAASRPLAYSLVVSGRRGWQTLAGSWGRRGRLLGRVAFAAVLVLVALSIYQLGVEVTARRTDALLDRMVYQGIARPLIFGVAHVAHFGPIVLLTAFVWPQVVRGISRFGPGLVLLFVGYIVLGLTSETRTITAVLPFVAGFTALAADRFQWRTWQIVGFTGLSLFVSRFWFPINQGAIDEPPYLEYPAQFYFMNFGPWMSNHAYAVFSVALVVVALATALILIPARRRISSRSKEVA